VKFAELRVVSDNECQVLIYFDQWKRLINHDGFGGGYRRLYIYWANLSGPGPAYVNPHMMRESIYQSDYKGTISVDREKRTVVINLTEIISKPGEVEKLVPSPINGLFHIKDINHNGPDSRTDLNQPRGQDMSVWR